MSTPANYMQSLLQLYKGADQGGTAGAQRILSGLGSGAKLVGSSSIAPEYQDQLQGAGNTLGGGANALGIYNGINQGGVTGYGGAAINATNLAGRTGALPAGLAKPIGNTANDLSSILGIYSGIKQGGVAGDASAAINAAKLGSNVGAFGGASGAIGSAAGAAAVPLSIYNEISNWQSGATGSDALAGAESGAAIGSMIVPGIGTLVGGLLGGAAGAISSAFGNGRVDPENKNFESYTQAYNKAASSDPSQAGQIAGSLQNPYLPLAGYFDLRSNQMKGSNPIYQAYGRMGEEHFTNDLISKVQSAQATNPKESAQDIYNTAVQPWLNSMGNWQDSNKAAMTDLIKNMTGQIATGTYQQDFKSIGGQSPFVKPQAKATGGIVRHFDSGGGVWDSGISDDDVTVTAPSTNDSFDWSDYIDSIGNGAMVPITDSTPLPTGGIDDVSELQSVQNALSSNPGLLSQLGSMSAGQLASLGLAGLGGILAGANSQPNMTANYKPTPPPMFNNTGPVAPGQSQYGNFSTTPRTQTHPNIDYAHSAETGGVPMFFSPSQSSTPSPLASGLPAASSSPVAPQSSPLASGTSGLVGAGASGPGAVLGNVLQQPSPAPAPQQQIPVPVQNAQMINQMYGNNGMSLGVGPLVGTRNTATRTSRFADGGQAHSDGISPLMMGMNLAHGTHVKGPGDGTSDEIPAVLSDGEYVIPAHVVSALGNGSNDAGAKALDALQEKVRMHVGKQMAQGKHPGRIGNPEKYLK